MNSSGQGNRGSSGDASLSLTGRTQPLPVSHHVTFLNKTLSGVHRNASSVQAAKVQNQGSSWTETPRKPVKGFLPVSSDTVVTSLLTPLSLSICFCLPLLEGQLHLVKRGHPARWWLRLLIPALGEAEG